MGYPASRPQSTKQQRARRVGTVCRFSVSTSGDAGLVPGSDLEPTPTGFDSLHLHAIKLRDQIPVHQPATDKTDHDTLHLVDCVLVADRVLASKLIDVAL